MAKFGDVRNVATLRFETIESAANVIKRFFEPLFALPPWDRFYDFFNSVEKMDQK
jgi:hypothetical protein